MNTQFKVKLLSHLIKKNQNKGFTLIELLVVVIIVGVLAAIALPNLLGQVAKGRQAEAKNNLGAINRAQQAYRLEKATFGALSQLPIAIGKSSASGFDGQYYLFATSGTPGPLGAAYNATALTEFTNDIKDYGAAVAQTAAGQFSQVICEATSPTASDYAPNSTADGCGTQTQVVK